MSPTREAFEPSPSSSLEYIWSPDNQFEYEAKAAIRNNISQNTLDNLLKTLRKVEVKDLPFSAKALLNTSS